MWPMNAAYSFLLFSLINQGLFSGRRASLPWIPVRYPLLETQRLPLVVAVAAAVLGKPISVPKQDSIQPVAANSTTKFNS